MYKIASISYIGDTLESRDLHDYIKFNRIFNFSVAKMIQLFQTFNSGLYFSNFEKCNFKTAVLKC